jgi:hypothetical protein
VEFHGPSPFNQFLMPPIQGVMKLWVNASAPNLLMSVMSTRNHSPFGLVRFGSKMLCSFFSGAGVWRPVTIQKAPATDIGKPLLTTRPISFHCVCSSSKEGAAGAGHSPTAHRSTRREWHPGATNRTPKMGRHRKTAAEMQAETRAEDLAGFERQRQRRRDRVIAEFGADPQAMADEILRYRHCVLQMGDAIGWTRQGESFIAMIGRRKPAVTETAEAT